MRTDLQKWNPFRLLRKSGGRTARIHMANDRPQSGHAPPGRAWQLSAGQWRMMHELLHDAYAGPGAFDRRFGDFTPTHLQPHVDVVGDGDALRVAAELPGMGREDLHATIGNGTLVLRDEKKAGRAAVKKRAVMVSNVRTAYSCKPFRCLKTSTPTGSTQSSKVRKGRPDAATVQDRRNEVHRPQG